MTREMFFFLSFFSSIERQIKHIINFEAYKNATEY